MATWNNFTQEDPPLAALGRDLFGHYGLAYLATVRPDGGPRLHPVCPVIANGRLLLGIISTTPKRYDLQRDGRYILHSLPGPDDAEFFVKGRARQLNQAEVQAILQNNEAVEVGHPAELAPDQGNTIFELDIEAAYATAYNVHENGGKRVLEPVRQKWQAAQASPIAAAL